MNKSTVPSRIYQTFKMSPSKRNVSYDNSSIHSNSTNNASRVSLGVSVLLPLLFTVILLGNLLVLLTVRSFRVRHVPDLLVASLALVELTNDLGPIMISMIVSNLHPSGFDSVQLEALCQFYNWFSCCLRLSACFIATLMALDRLCATVAPFFYRISVTNANVLNLVLSVVLSAAFISSWPALGWGRVLPHRALCSFDFGGGFALFIAFLGYIQLFFVLGSFVAVTWATTRHMKRLEAVRRGRAWTVERGQLRTVSDGGDGWQKRTEGARNTRWRESLQFIRMLGVAVFLFYLSWLPIVVSS